MQEKFFEWLEVEAQSRGLYNDRMIAKAADLSPSVLSKARTNYQAIGWEACIKIADALQVPHQVTLVLAGHIEAEDSEWDAQTEELVSAFSKLSKKDREEILLLLRYKLR